MHQNSVSLDFIVMFLLKIEIRVVFLCHESKVYLLLYLDKMCVMSIKLVHLRGLFLQLRFFSSNFAAFFYQFAGFFPIFVSKLE